MLKALLLSNISSEIICVWNGHAIKDGIVHQSQHGLKIEMAGYPNPANEFINVSFNGTPISGNIYTALTDLQGRNIGVYISREKLNQFDAFILPNGIYFLTINTNFVLETYKIICRLP